MVATSLMSKVVETGIDYQARSMEKPSDHCPVWVDIKL